ncbi:hypothetical protein Y032_0312g2164 [Ancylostoma ceylanicum]|uniref:Uncharacterized protein n=1 Tax=Ancylostoma ceylanicum TaxID=53326 RepID=A0A016S2D7_9BILA|nr:hypothetical protein Y032_0312g2164 [Ancylostoma ceylanicum]
MRRRGMAPLEICRRLKVNRKLVYQALKRGTTDDLPSTDRRITVTTARMKKIMKKRLETNPCCSMRKTATELGFSRKSLHRIVEDKLGMGAYKLRKLHGLSENKRAARVKKCRTLLERAVGGAHMRMFFTDEKLLTIEQVYNLQNDRLYAGSHTQTKMSGHAEDGSTHFLRKFIGHAVIIFFGTCGGCSRGLRLMPEKPSGLAEDVVGDAAYHRTLIKASDGCGGTWQVVREPPDA